MQADWLKQDSERIMTRFFTIVDCLPGNLSISCSLLAKSPACQLKSNESIPEITYDIDAIKT